MAAVDQLVSVYSVLQDAGPLGVTWHHKNNRGEVDDPFIPLSAWHFDRSVTYDIVLFDLNITLVDLLITLKSSCKTGSIPIHSWLCACEGTKGFSLKGLRSNPMEVK